MNLLITGASGSGTTTLGQALASTLNWTFVDTDDLFWLPTDPPFTTRRERNQRCQQMRQALVNHENLVVSGSVMDWGADIEDAFDCIVFLYLDTTIRITRLKVREMQRYGFINQESIDWASGYDHPASEGRSLAKHKRWLAARSCTILTLEGDLSVKERLQRVLRKISI